MQKRSRIKEYSHVMLSLSLYATSFTFINDKLPLIPKAYKLSRDSEFNRF